MNFSLEICTDNVESAIEAQNAGAGRIELCNNLTEGGTTPGYGTIASARKNLSAGLHVMIRPREGDFLYSNTDYDIMRREIEICGECGVNGVVLGILLADGSIDIDRTGKLIELARPMSATFHRAFDMCNYPFKGLEDVIATGADRLLTSGQQNKASEGIDLIYNLIKRAAGRIIIMPGSGINESNIMEIARRTGASEFHLTARKSVDSEMIFRAHNISLGSDTNISEFSRKVVDRDMIRSIVCILKLI
jgi:copper homeostasis protein